MNGIATRSIGLAALAGATMVVACTGDIETLPPLDFYSNAGRTASNGDGASGGTSSGSTGGTGTAGMPGSTGTGGAGGSSAAGGAGGATSGTGAGGTSSGAAGTPGGGTFTGAGTGGAGASTGGLASGGAAAGGAGSSGRGGTGFGSGGRGGAGMGGVSAAGGAAAGTAGSTGGTGASFTPIAAFFQRTCAEADCHGGKERPSLTNTNPGTLYNTLKNTAVRQCGSDRLVTPNDPANSAVLELVQQQCGMFVMPEDCKTNPCISADDLALLTQWIQAGAPGP